MKQRHVRDLKTRNLHQKRHKTYMMETGLTPVQQRASVCVTGSKKLKQSFPKCGPQSSSTNPPGDSDWCTLKYENHWATGIKITRKSYLLKPVRQSEDHRKKIMPNITNQGLGFSHKPPTATMLTNRLTLFHVPIVYCLNYNNLVTICPALAREVLV